MFLPTSGKSDTATRMAKQSGNRARARVRSITMATIFTANGHQLWRARARRPRHVDRVYEQTPLSFDFVSEVAARIRFLPVRRSRHGEKYTAYY